MNSSFQIQILLEVPYVDLQLFAVTDTNGVSPLLLLFRCLMKEDKSRWSVHQLLEHSFIKMALPLHLPITRHETQQEDESQGLYQTTTVLYVILTPEPRPLEL